MSTMLSPPPTGSAFPSPAYHRSPLTFAFKLYERYASNGWNKHVNLELPISPNNPPPLKVVKISPRLPLLPAELWLHIATHLNSRDTKALSSVSKYLRGTLASTVFQTLTARTEADCKAVRRFDAVLVHVRRIDVRGHSSARWRSHGYAQPELRPLKKLLQALPRLSSLSLSATWIPPFIVHFILTSQSLRHLELHDCVFEVPDRRTGDPRSLIESFDIDRGEVSNGARRMLLWMPNLKRLSVDNCTAHDFITSVSQREAPSQVTHYSWTYASPMNTNIWSTLASWKHVSHLTIGTLAPISTPPKLPSLQVLRCTIHNAIRIVRCTPLEQLVIIPNASPYPPESHIVIDLLRALSTTTSVLRKIDGIHLSIDDMEVLDSPHVSVLESCVQLGFIIFGEFKKLTPGCIKPLVENLTKLRSFSITLCKPITQIRPTLSKPDLLGLLEELTSLNGDVDHLKYVGGSVVLNWDRICCTGTDGLERRSWKGVLDLDGERREIRYQNGIVTTFLTDL